MYIRPVILILICISLHLTDAGPEGKCAPLLGFIIFKAEGKMQNCKDISGFSGRPLHLTIRKGLQM